MNNLTVTIEKNDAIQFLEDFTDIVHKAKAGALRKGANVIKTKAQQSLASTGVQYTKRNPRYSDTLKDAIRTTKIREDNTIGIHILGSKAKTSGTYRLRFFENGTKERFATTYKGQPLKKKRRLGRIKAYKFFESAVTSSQSQAQKAIAEQLTKQIDKAWNNYQ